MTERLNHSEITLYSLDQRIEELAYMTGQNFNRNETRFMSIEARLDRLEQRIDRLEQRMDRIEQLLLSQQAILLKLAEKLL